MKKTILLVDDDQSVRESLGKALEGENFDVILASNGQEALAKFDPSQVDLVLLDLMMPVQGGWRTFEELNAMNPFLPIIIITGDPNQFPRQQLFAVVALLKKPIEMSTLIETMKALLSEEAGTRQRRYQSYKSCFRSTHSLMSDGELNTRKWKRSP